MFCFGLVGWPVEHSVSPQIHQAALIAAGLTGEYRLFPVLPSGDGFQRLGNLLGQMRQGEIHGLNVTIPHKQAVIPFLDHLSPISESTGTVNTILPSDDHLLGDNTDSPGFLADLQRIGVRDPGSALVLGAGGSARAVVYGLSRAGWTVTVAAREFEKAMQLSQELGSGDFQVSIATPTGRREKYDITPTKLDLISLSKVAPTSTLIINCTPVGMVPGIQASPWPDRVPFPPDAIVYDLVYNPAETRLVRTAREAGLTAFTGLGMLVEQAALSFESWTGREADRTAMRLAAQASLESG